MRFPALVRWIAPALTIAVTGVCTGEETRVTVDGVVDAAAKPIHNPNNGHYYEFVGETELSWPEAKKLAESRVLHVDGKKLQGYLVTVTDEHEQEHMEKHFLGPPNVKVDVWMGATDAEVDDEWRWVTGPEGKEDGGKGRLFFNQDRESVGYTNWLRGEPNNVGGKESYMQWNHVPVRSIPPAKWNDQPIDKPGSKGYFVEYGGIEG